MITYELVPPQASLTAGELRQFVNFFSVAARGAGITTINIPEIRDEKSWGVRKKPFLAKIEPRILSLQLNKQGFETIINRPIVYIPWLKQTNWLKETYKKYKVRNIVFVGGEDPNVKYPGPSVGDAVQKTLILRHDLPNILIGGITIPTRPFEAKRVFSKAKAGCQYFFSQIIYDAKPVKKLLLDYQNLCHFREVSPKTLIFTFAPISSKADIDFFSYLGVSVPESVQKQLFKNFVGIGFRSLDVCANLLEEIYTFIKMEKIEVPVGINISHITKGNFELSFQLYKHLSKLYSELI